MDLYIIRHAQAGHYGDPQWPDDSQRPLSKRGQQRFAEMAAILAERGFAPGVIATSPMVRCVQTARLAAAAVPDGPAVVEMAELLPSGDIEPLLKWTAEQAQQHPEIAWVGHAPDVSRLTAELIGAAEAMIRFGKGTVAAIRFHDLPEVGDGELRWLVTAKLLGC